MKNIAISIVVVLLAFAANAKDKEVKSKADIDSKATVELTGSISDIKSGELLVGVEVQLEGTDIKTYTDFDGNFSIKVKPGEYKLVTNYISYEKITKTLNVESKENQVSIKMLSSN